MSNGAAYAKDFFHLPVMGSVSDNIPSTRIVVLRNVDSTNRAITFHTDIRSDKVTALQLNPNISFLFYHPDDRIQVRLNGLAVIEYASALADEAWLKSNTSSRKCYLAEKGSGELTNVPEDSLPVAFSGINPSTEESERGRKNFCVVKSTILQMEWVWLNYKGHRRARFQYTTDGLVATWLIP